MEPDRLYESPFTDINPLAGGGVSVDEGGSDGSGVGGDSKERGGVAFRLQPN